MGVRLVKFEKHEFSEPKAVQWLKSDAKDIISTINNRIESNLYKINKIKMNLKEDHILNSIDSVIKYYNYVDECFDKGIRESKRRNLISIHNPKLVRCLQLKSTVSEIQKYSRRISITSRRLVVMLLSFDHENERLEYNYIKFLYLMIKKMIDNFDKWDRRLMKAVNRLPGLLELFKCDGFSNLSGLLLGGIIEYLDDALLDFNESIEIIENIE
jgi:hypothetical protein